MKDIKFRAWNPNLENMINDISLKGLSELRNADKFSELALQMIYDWNDLIWMQYINVKDSENRHICEGDILLKETDGFIGVIEYEPQGAQFIIRNKEEKRYRDIASCAQYGDENGIILSTVKIIGNIYQTPNLI